MFCYRQDPTTDRTISCDMVYVKFVSSLLSAHLLKVLSEIPWYRIHPVDQKQTPAESNAKPHSFL